MEEERSGFDILEEILRRLDLIEKRLGVLDHNIKTIVNTTRIADMVNKAAGTPADTFARAVPKKATAKEKIEQIRSEARSGFKNFNFESSDASKLKSNVVPANRAVRKPKNIMVQGKMIAKTGDKTRSLPSISVKIYDSNDKLVKETRTNRAGHWMSQLPPGRYVALFEGELGGKKLVPQNRNFEVPEELPTGQTFIEVV